MKLKEFIIGMVSTGETSVNSKIVGGIISLFSTIGFGYLKYNESMLIMAGLTASFFGLSSLDFKTHVRSTELKQDNEQI